MTDKKASGIKSSFDLTMQRLEQRDGKTATLTASQKEAIAEVDSKAKAKIAEIEIMFQQKRAAAQTTGDPAEVEEIERQRRSELEKIRSHSEEERESIRRG